MIINKSGIVIRIAVSELRVMGRATQGVRLISLKGDDEIASITKVAHEETEIEALDNDHGLAEKDDSDNSNPQTREE